MQLHAKSRKLSIICGIMAINFCYATDNTTINPGEKQTAVTPKTSDSLKALTKEKMTTGNVSAEEKKVAETIIAPSQKTKTDSAKTTINTIPPIPAQKPSYILKTTAVDKTIENKKAPETITVLNQPAKNDSAKISIKATPQTSAQNSLTTLKTPVPEKATATTGIVENKKAPETKTAPNHTTVNDSTKSIVNSVQLPSAQNSSTIVTAVKSDSANSSAPVASGSKNTSKETKTGSEPSKK
jgi:hypothetical protein